MIEIQHMKFQESAVSKAILSTVYIDCRLWKVYTVFDQLTNMNSILITDWSKNIENFEKWRAYCRLQRIFIFYFKLRSTA